MTSILSSGWLPWLLAIAGAYVFGVPLLIWKMLKHEVQTTLQPIDTQACPLPDVIQQHLDTAEVALTGAGFVAVGTFFMPSPLPNVRNFVRLYSNRATKDTAMANSTFGVTNDQVTHQMQYVEFCSRYADGSEFNTSNAKIGGGSFPPRPKVVSVQLPWVTDVGQLHHVHQAIMDAKAPRAAKELTLERDYGGDAAAYIAGSIREELTAAVNAGYLYLSPSGSQYYATLKGAYLMTWRQLAPTSWFAKAWRRARVRRVLTEAGVA